VLIEHDMGVVMDISDHVVVLDRGRRIAAGTPGEVQRGSAKVIEAYLGTGRRTRYEPSGRKGRDYRRCPSSARNAREDPQARGHPREDRRRLADR
jgi:energy-coupling factor transporter ATP-binding protein EcfA2